MCGGPGVGGRAPPVKEMVVPKRWCHTPRGCDLVKF